MAWALVWLLLMVVAFYFLIVRPQRRRMLEMRALQASIDVGDEVVTSAGIYGFVKEIQDVTVMLEIAPGTTIRVARAAVAQKLTDATEPGAGADGPDDGPVSGG